MKKKLENEVYREEQRFQLENSIKNHSSSYIEDRLKELELIADELIQFALWRWEKNPKEKDDILKETEEYLNQRIGQGSIGPATRQQVHY